MGREKGRDARGGEGKGEESKGEEGRGREGKMTPMNVGWLRACIGIVNREIYISHLYLVPP